METRTYTVYTFNELPEESKNKVLERYWDWNVDNSFWYESVQDFFAEKIKEYGLKLTDIGFIGFCSQGDGASLSYEVESESTYLNYLLANIAPQHQKYWKRMQSLCKTPMEWLSISYCTQKTSGYRRNYARWAAIEINGDSWRDNTPRLNAFIAALQEAAEELHNDLEHELYKDLEREYDYQTSENALREFFEDHYYLFTIEGRLD